MGKVMMRPPKQIEGLLDLIKELGDVSDKTMIEIGCFIGESTVEFAKQFKHVITIDPFLPDYDPMDTTSRHNFDKVYMDFRLNTHDYRDKITLHKMLSNDAVKLFAGQQFDFVYIDGLHTYEGVKMDILNYLPLVKEGGAIGGHDYGNASPHVVGVTKAVDELFGKPDKRFKDTSWIKFL